MTNEHQHLEEHDEDLVPEDDTIIARAFSWSMAAIAVVLLIAAAVLLLIDEEETVAETREVAASAPEARPAVEIEPPHAPFLEVSDEWGVRFRHHNGAYGERLLPETMGSGIAIFDMDGDADQDLLLLNGADWPWRRTVDSLPTARLYRNDGDGSFTDVTEGSGLDTTIYATGVAVGDHDADGVRDLFIAAVGENHLFRGLGDGTFEDVTDDAGVAGEPGRWSSSAMFVDHDRDGDLDLFVTNYVEWSRDIDLEVDYRLTGVGRAYGPPTNYAGTHSYLYRNEGDGTFTDVSAEAGIQITNPATGLPMGKGLAVTAADVDSDGWLDLIVANDTVQNFLFRNLGDGRFEELGALSGVAFDNTGAATGAMGVDAGFYADDGRFAVAIGNFANEMSSFYVSDLEMGLFTDEAIVSGIGPDSRAALSFGLFFLDFDLDGRLDLFQTNGHVEDEINVVQPSQHYEQPSQLFWNCGMTCPREFIQMPAAKVGDLAQPVVGRGAAYGDLDGDGDLDIVLSQAGRAARVLRNDQDLGHSWLRVRLEGPAGNPDGIGATIRMVADGRTQERLVMPARSYQSSMEPVTTFGLGEADRVTRVEVIWPDGTERRIEGVAVDQELVVSY